MTSLCKDEQKLKTHPATPHGTRLTEDYFGAVLESLEGAAYYCKLLGEIQCENRLTRNELTIYRALMILLHDNSYPHTTNLTNKKLGEMSWTTLEIPSYRSDDITSSIYAEDIRKL